MPDVEVVEATCVPNVDGMITWCSDTKVITEFDPFFVCAWGYNDLSDEAGGKHQVWMTISGATSLARTYKRREDAMLLMERIRVIKKRN